MAVSEASKPLLATPPSDQAYHEVIAQQMKMLQLQQESMVVAAAAAAASSGIGGVSGDGTPGGPDMSMFYQNPMALQQFMWMLNMQQQQQQQQHQQQRDQLSVSLYVLCYSK